MGGDLTPPSPNGTDTIRLTIGSRLELLSMVHAIITQISRQYKLSEDLENALLIAVIEAGTNAIQHGNCFAEDKSVEFEFSVASGEIVVAVDDFGTGFDSGKVVDDPTDAPTLLNPHGRGLYLMKELMDVVSFEIRADHGTRVLLRKSRVSATA